MRWSSRSPVPCAGSTAFGDCSSATSTPSSSSGSGRVLVGLVRRIDPEVDAFAADSPKKLAKFVERAED